MCCVDSAFGNDIKLDMTYDAIAHTEIVVYIFYLPAMASSRRHETLQASHMQATLAWSHQRRYHGAQNLGIYPVQIPPIARSY